MDPQMQGAYGAPPTAIAPPQGGVPHTITHGPSFGMLRVDLPPGVTLVAEAGAMVGRHDQVKMETKLNASPSAGFFETLKALIVAFIRRFVGGETFFVNHFTTPQPGSVWLAPTLSGPIVHRRLNGERLVLSTGAYLAHVGQLDLKMRWGGLRGLLAKEGLFFLELTGQGDLWFSSYGGVHAIDVNGSYLVDNGHVVGFEGNLDFDIKSAGGGLMGLVASGEGLVCEFRGQGRVYIQSRSVGSLVGWVTPLLPG
ncbi:MAG: TIGR00266 family protein [Polyangiales bacterium]